MSTPFEVRNTTMDGTWKRWRIPNGVNALLVQARTAVDIYVATEETGLKYLTIKANNSMVLGSFNTNNQLLYFKGGNGVVVELIAVNMP